MAKISTAEVNKLQKTLLRYGTGLLVPGGVAWTAGDAAKAVEALVQEDDVPKALVYGLRATLDAFFTAGAGPAWLNENRKAHHQSMQKPFHQNAPQAVMAGALVLREAVGFWE